MNRFRSDLSRQIRELSLQYRITLVEDVGFSIVVRDAHSIVSAVPYLTMSAEPNEFKRRRRRRLFICRDGREFEILARLRPSPLPLPRKGARNPDLVVSYARDSGGRRHPLSVLDPDTRTLHLLLDQRSVDALEPLEPVEVEDDEPAAAAVTLADLLVGDALRHLNELPQAPWVGGAVDEHLRVLLERQAAHRRPKFEREASFLRRVGADKALPRILARRLELLEKAIRGEQRRSVDGTVAELERDRLVRLVESRACGSIRLHRTEIRGLINPRMIDPERGHQSMMFALRPSPPPEGPRLRMWLVGRPEQGGARSMCLGEASDVIHGMEEAHDAYGLVDTVLNFVETNMIGVVPRGSRASRRRILDYLY